MIFQWMFNKFPYELIATVKWQANSESLKLFIKCIQMKEIDGSRSPGGGRGDCQVSELSGNLSQTQTEGKTQVECVLGVWAC